MSSNKDLTRLRTLFFGYSIGGVLVGGLLFGIAALAIEPEREGLRAGLELVGSSLFSASVAAIVFSTLAAHETEHQIDVTLDRKLRETFTPVKSRLHDVDLTSYRFRTYLTLDTTGDGDTYGSQAFTVAYTRSALPSSIYIVCAASYDDAVLDPYRDASQYVLRWQLEHANGQQDPEDPAIFRPCSVRVDNETLEPTMSVHTTEGVKVVKYRYQIPRRIRDRSSSRVQISAIARKRIEGQATVSLPVQLFASATDAEFLCVVDRAVGVHGLRVATDFVAIGPQGEQSKGECFPGPYGTVAAYARVGYAVQRGSRVTFYVERESQP